MFVLLLLTHEYSQLIVLSDYFVFNEYTIINGLMIMFRQRHGQISQDTAAMEQ